jgi:hypothetical protein
MKFEKASLVFRIREGYLGRPFLERNAMRILGLFLFLAAAVSSRNADADSAHWSVVSTPTRAMMAGGPWVLGEADASHPQANYPLDNTGVDLCAPYYHAYTVGTDQLVQGFFDYRPKDLGEAVVAALTDPRIC